MADEEYTNETAELQVGHLFADTVEPTSFAAFRRGETDQRLQVQGKIMPRNVSGQPGVEARALAWASLRPGLVVPVLSPVRPQVNGLYMVESAGTAEDAVWPALGARAASSLNATPQHRSVSVGLRQITGESAEAITTCWLSQMHPTSGGVEFGNTRARFGFPGDIVPPYTGTLDAASPYDLTLPNQLYPSRLQTLAVDANIRVSLTSSLAPFEFLAGSPRIEAFAGDVWHPCHGQPPSGYPLRVSNGLFGIELGHPGFPAIPARAGWPAVPAQPGAPRALVRFAPDGTVAQRTEMSFFTDAGFRFMFEPMGVTVEHADSEMIRVKFACRVLDLGGVRQTQGRQYTLVMRRGVVGAWLWASANTSVKVSAAKLEDVTDGAGTPKIVGGRTADFAVMGQKPVSVTTSGATFSVVDMGPLIRFEGGGSTYRTRAWAQVRSRVLR